MKDSADSAPTFEEKSSMLPDIARVADVSIIGEPPENRTLLNIPDTSIGAEFKVTFLPPTPVASIQYTDSGSDRQTHSSMAFFIPATFRR